MPSYCTEIVDLWQKGEEELVSKASRGAEEQFSPLLMMASGWDIGIRGKRKFCQRVKSQSCIKILTAI
jgi:hypothetical protein